MAKKTKDQFFDEWQSKISKRYLYRKALPEYQEIIKELSSNHDVTAKLKRFVECYGPIDPYLEGLPLEEVNLLTEAGIGIDAPVFEDAWIVKPIEWPWKSPLMKGKDRYKINWDVYLDDEGFIRFAVRQNTPRQIKEALESWLTILRKNKVITFKPRRNPNVSIIGSLSSREHPGVLIRFNPFALKERILEGVIQALKRIPKFVFSRKDSLHPLRIRAIRLWKEGRNLKEIASALWPQEWKEWCDKEDKLIPNCYRSDKKAQILREQYQKERVDKGVKNEQARKEAEEKFQLSKNSPTNALIVRAWRLIN